MFYGNFPYPKTTYYFCVKQKNLYPKKRCGHQYAVHWNRILLQLWCRKINEAKIFTITLSPPIT